MVAPERTSYGTGAKRCLPVFDWSVALRPLTKEKVMANDVGASGALKDKDH